MVATIIILWERCLEIMVVGKHRGFFSDGFQSYDGVQHIYPSGTLKTLRSWMESILVSMYWYLVQRVEVQIYFKSSPNRILRRLSDFHGSEKMSETSTGRNVNFVCPLWRNVAARWNQPGSLDLLAPSHTTHFQTIKTPTSSTTDGTHLVVPISSSIIVDCFLSHPIIHKIRIYVSFANKIKDEWIDKNIPDGITTGRYPFVVVKRGDQSNGDRRPYARINLCKGEDEFITWLDENPLYGAYISVFSYVYGSFRRLGGNNQHRFLHIRRRASCTCADIGQQRARCRIFSRSDVPVCYGIKLSFDSRQIIRNKFSQFKAGWTHSILNKHRNVRRWNHECKFGLDDWVIQRRCSRNHPH